VLRGRPTGMRFFGALVLAAAVSCATATPAGGVRGVVTAGPTCPVARPGSPCPPAPWTGTVRATSSTGATYDAATDANGVFELHLPDGTYTVQAVTQGTGPPIARPASVTVAGTMQTLDLQLDTGIR
jgi:Carboxypeptidase regulatory-like domain